MHFFLKFALISFIFFSTLKDDKYFLLYTQWLNIPKKLLMKLSVDDLTPGPQLVFKVTVSFWGFEEST